MEIKKYIFYVENGFNLVTKEIFATLDKLGLHSRKLQLETRYGLPCFLNRLQTVVSKGYTPVLIGRSNTLDITGYEEYKRIQSDDNLLAEFKKFLGLEITEQDQIISDYTYKGLGEVLKTGISIREARDLRREALAEMDYLYDRDLISRCDEFIKSEWQNGNFFCIRDLNFEDRILIDSIDLFRFEEKKELNVFYTSSQNSMDMLVQFYGNPIIVNYLASLEEITTIKPCREKTGFWSGFIPNSAFNRIISQTKKIALQ